MIAVVALEEQTFLLLLIFDDEFGSGVTGADGNSILPLPGGNCDKLTLMMLFEDAKNFEEPSLDGDMGLLLIRCPIDEDERDAIYRNYRSIQARVSDRSSNGMFQYALL